MKRQRRSVGFKLQIVEESFAEDTSVEGVARVHGVNANQVFTQHRLYRQGWLGSGNNLAYPPDRKGEHQERRLGEFRGALHYGGFNHLYEDGRIQEVVCWMQVRRKVYDRQVAHQSPIAQETLEWITALQAIEASIRGRPPCGRREVRQAQARRLLKSLRDWLESCLTKLSRKSGATPAVKYALGLQETLVRYTKDGRPEIDNNAAERALRVVALGRKDSLFAGPHVRGVRAALLYSLIGTAKLNRLDPENQLCDALSRIADHPIDRIEALLPWKIVPSGSTPSTTKIVVNGVKDFSKSIRQTSQ